MPSLYYHIPSAGINILKPVTDQVVTAFLDEMDLLRSFKNSIYIVQPFTANSQYNNGSDNSPTIRKNRCDVEVSHILDKSQVPWPVDTVYTTVARGITSDKKGNHTHILADPDAGILIEHHTVACALDMNFTLTFQTYDEATRAFDSLQSQFKGMPVQRPYTLAFSYPLSMPILAYLYTVSQAKAAYKNKPLIDYINDTKVTQISFDVRKTQIAEAESDKELMVRVQQLGCLAQVTFDQREPDSIRTDNLPDYFTISLNLLIQFGRPDLIAVHSPVSVENTVLPDIFFKNNLENFHYNPGVSGMYQDMVCSDWMARSFGNYEDRMMITRFPEYDDWFHADELYAFYKYRPFVIAHFTLEGEVTTIDLKHLDDLNLHPVAQEILKATKNKVFEYGGLFHIGVYADKLRLGTNLLTLSEDLILTIHSKRPDQEYHLVLSETTELSVTDPEWNDLLVKYRYFFPLTIEQNLDYLVKAQYLYVENDNSLLNLISRMNNTGKLRPVLRNMVAEGEVGNDIFGYTQSASQLADYLMLTPSAREDYTIPKLNPDDPQSPPNSTIVQYYNEKASIEGRSLFVAFVEQALIQNYVTLDRVPDQYLRANQTMFPYNYISGGYYGFNTPLRVFRYDITPKRHTQ